MSGRRGGRGRNPKDMPREQQVSRKVSWLLRHGAGSEGLTLGKGGYVGVQDVLNTRALKSLSVTFEELKAVVKSNDKQRFSMVTANSLKDDDPVPDTMSAEQTTETSAPDTVLESDNPSDYLIRANQGHSIKVDTEGLLDPITPEAGNVPQVCVHGTDERAWGLILKSGGMRRMGRNHMHFASGLPEGFKSMASSDAAEADNEAPPVISGMRKSSTILIYVDIEAALEQGIKFFRSENGVILTEGDEHGVLSYEFFRRVERRQRAGGILMENGVLPEGTEIDVKRWEEEVGASRGKGKGRGVRGGGRGRERGGAKGRAPVTDDSKDILAGT